MKSFADSQMKGNEATIQDLKELVQEQVPSIYCTILYIYFVFLRAKDLMASPWPMSPDIGFLKDVWIRTPLLAAVASRGCLLNHSSPSNRPSPSKLWL
jgi:hypothetical protein